MAGKAPSSKITSADVDAFLNASSQPKKQIYTGTVTPKDIDAFLADKKEEPGMLEKIGRGALDTAIAVGEKIDAYTGAPVRSAIGAAQEGGNPLTAYVNQFAKGDASQAPTGKQIATKAGLSTEEKYRVPFTDYKFSPAGAAGLGVDLLADPTNVIGIGAATKGAAKLGTKAAVEAASLGARGTALGVDVLTSTKAGTKALEYGAEKANQVRKVFEDYFKPQRAPDFEQMFSVAQKHGIDTKKLPEAVEFGKDSVITRLARARAEGPLGEKYLREFTESLDQVDNATQKAVSKIGGGAVPSREQAGKILREGYDESVANLYKDMEIRHSKIAKQNPNFVLPEPSMKKIYDKVNDITQFAENRLRYGAPGEQKAQAKYLIEMADALRASNGTYENFYNFLQNVGEDAFKKNSGSLVIASDKKKMKELYGALSDAMTSSVDSISPGAAAELRANNRKISEFLKTTEPIAKKLEDMSMANETLFDSLVKRGDSKQLESLKAIMPGEKFQQLKAAYLDSIIPRSAEGGIHYRTFSNVLRKDKDRLAHLLNPGEAQDILELTDLGTRFGTPILSTSGTGASNRLRNLPTAIADSLLDDTAIEKLKLSARGRTLEVAPGKLKGFTAPISSPSVSYGLRKGAQVYSTQKQEEGK